MISDSIATRCTKIEYTILCIENIYEYIDIYIYIWQRIWSKALLNITSLVLQHLQYIELKTLIHRTKTQKLKIARKKP